MTDILQTVNVLDGVLDFLLFAPTPEQVIAFRPSAAAQARASELLEKNRSGRLTAEENAELDELSRVNHWLILLKARARLHLQKAATSYREQ